MEKLSKWDKLQRLSRICPEVLIAPVLEEEEHWRVLLPRTAFSINSGPFNAEFVDVTFDRVIEKAWGTLTSVDAVILADGRFPWESVMVLKWDSDMDDWKNLPEPNVPLFKLATYKPKS